MTRLTNALVGLLALGQIFTFPNLSTQREVTAEIEINASPERVWTILTDFPAYTNWNPYIYPAKGEATKGAKLDLTLHPGGAPIAFQPVVLAADPNRELSWSGRVFGPVVFERSVTFTIQQTGPHRVRLLAREVFKGLLLPLVGGLPDDARRGLDLMNHALRASAELEPAPHAP